MLLTKEIEVNNLAQRALRRFTQCRWIGHTTFQMRGGYCHWAIAPAKSPSPMPRYQVMLWYAVGA